MTVKSNVKAGALSMNHNETLVVRSNVKGGKIISNHNEALVVRSNVKAGESGLSANHNESFRRYVAARALLLRF